MNLDLSLVGWLHTAACIIAMASFFVVMLARKGSKAHKDWGKAYTLSYVALCVTSLGIYAAGRFWFPHILAIAGLGVVLVGWAVARYRRPPGWRHIHLICMLLTGWNLWGGAINEAFLRIAPLNAMIGGNFNAPIVGLAHFANMVVFFLLIVAYVIVAVVRWPPRARPQAV